RGCVRDRRVRLVRDHDRRHVTAARVGAAAAGAQLTRVGEVVLVPGDDDGVTAVVPLLRGHDRVDGVVDVVVTGGNEVRVGAATGAVHVVALIRDDHAVARQRVVR